MNSEEAREKIIDFVVDHQGCTAQNIVDGVEKAMSRTLVFRYLPQMVKEGIIEDKNLNRRDHRFFVNSISPLLLISLELNEFENRLNLWIADTRKKYDDQISLWKRTNHREDFDYAEDLGTEALFAVNTIFSHIFSTYTTEVLSFLSKFSNDPEFLDKLYSKVLSTLHRIMSNISKQIPFIGYERPDNRKSGGWGPPGNVMNLDSFRSIHRGLKKYALDSKEYDDLMGIIWKISDNVLPAINKEQHAEMLAVGWKKVFENPDRYP